MAAVISSLANIALITDTPSIPLPFSFNKLSALIPPIATTGIDTVSHISFNVSNVTLSASPLVEVGKTAPLVVF